MALQPELVIFGSGSRLRFPQAPWVRALVEARIGIDEVAKAGQHLRMQVGRVQQIVERPSDAGGPVASPAED